MRERESSAESLIELSTEVSVDKPVNAGRLMASGSRAPKPGKSPSIEDVESELRSAFGPDVALLTAELHSEHRGHLSVIDFDALPFTVRRVFTVTNVPAGTRRGGHSHRWGEQGLFCLEGRIEVELRRGETRTVVTLRPDGVGIQIPARVWASQLYVVENSELLVLASEPFDPSTYHSEPAHMP